MSTANTQGKKKAVSRYVINLFSCQVSLISKHTVKIMPSCLFNSVIVLQMSVTCESNKRLVWRLFCTAYLPVSLCVWRLGTTKIFVGNIRDGTTSEQLRVLFQAYCRVTEADVLSGFGFVVSSFETSLSLSVPAYVHGCIATDHFSHKHLYTSVS